MTDSWCVCLITSNDHEPLIAHPGSYDADWTRDEIILACALAESNGWRQVYDTDPRAKDLSQLLQSPAIHPLLRHRDFRNPAGVGQKTRNIVDWHPDHRGS